MVGERDYIDVAWRDTFDAGVDCIEHGTMISDETIKLMAEKGTFLCPTVEQGKLADLIVVEENPPENISNLRKLKMVFKDGKTVNLARERGSGQFLGTPFSIITSIQKK